MRLPTLVAAVAAFGVTLGTSSSAHAVPAIEACYDYANAAAKIMDGRQLGLPRQRLINGLDLRDVKLAAVITPLVDQAYAEPRRTPLADRQAAVRSYRERAYSYCVHTAANGLR